MNAASARAVNTIASQLDAAATTWGIVTGLAAIVAAWALRDAGVATWAPLLAVGLSAAWLGYTAGSLAAALARLRTSEE